MASKAEKARQAAAEALLNATKHGGDMGEAVNKTDKYMELTGKSKEEANADVIKEAGLET